MMNTEGKAYMQKNIPNSPPKTPKKVVKDAKEEEKQLNRQVKNKLRIVESSESEEEVIKKKGRKEKPKRPKKIPDKYFYHEDASEIVDSQYDTVFDSMNEF
jgi:hypothetical protein